MNFIGTLFALVLMIWIMCFGFAMILQQHRRFAHWTGQMLRRIGHYLWAHYRQFIIGLIIGLIIGASMRS